MADSEINQSLLDFAIEGNKEEVIGVLDKGADINFCDRFSKAAIHYAAERGNVDIVRLLIDKKADIDIGDQDGQTPLHYSSRRGHIAVTMALLSQYNPAKVNAIDKDGKSALHLASEEGHALVVKLLLDSKADAHIQDKSGRTPLNYTYYKYSCEDVKTLLEDSRASVNFDWVLLDSAKARDYHSDIPFSAIKSGANISFHDADKRTALHYAAVYDHLKLVQKLIELKKGLISCKDKEEKTALHYAVKNQNYRTVELLIDKDNSIINSKDKEEKTPLHYAAEHGHQTIVKKLIDKGCSAIIDSKDKEEKTALHYAAEHGHFEIVRDLFDKGRSAIINSKDKNGDTPLHHACRKGHISTITFLLSLANINWNAQNNFHQIPKDLLPPSIDSGTATCILRLFEQLDSRDIFPIGSYSKVFVYGTAAAGKSSLAQIIKSRACNPPDHQYDPLEAITVEPSTPCIEPYIVNSEEIGNIVVYDLGGSPKCYSDREVRGYSERNMRSYSDNDAFSANLVGESPSVIVIVIDLRRDEHTIVNELLYCLSFARMIKPCKVIVVGSHADYVSIKKEEVYYNTIDEIVTKAIRGMYGGFVAMECHRPGGRGVAKFIHLLASSCRVAVDESALISDDSLLCYSFIIDLKVVAISTEEVNLKLKDEVTHPILQDKLGVSLVASLSDRGVILFLPSPDSYKCNGWIIIDVVSLLSEIKSVLFALNTQEIISNIGIVSLSHLEKALPKYDKVMLVQFLKTLELGYTIDSTFSSKRSNLRLTSFRRTETEAALFFPSFINNNSAAMTVAPAFGQCFWYPDADKCVSTRSVYSLLLRLALWCPRLDTTAAHEYWRSCTLWRNGIYWNIQNIEVIVEVSELNQCLTVLLSEKNGMSALEMRSLLMNTIESLWINSKASEYIIAPDQLASVHSLPFHKRCLIPLQNVARALTVPNTVINDQYQRNQFTVKELVNDCEPYLSLPAGVIKELFTGDSSTQLSVSRLHYFQAIFPELLLNTVLPPCTVEGIKEQIGHNSLIMNRRHREFVRCYISESESLQESFPIITERKPQLHELTGLFSPVASQWKEIGSILKVSRKIMEELKKSSNGVAYKLLTVFDSWIKENPNSVSWETIITDLKKFDIDGKDVALEALKFFESHDFQNTHNIPVLYAILCGILEKIPNWKDLGVQLSIDKSELEKIFKKGSLDCLKSVLSLWLQRIGVTNNETEKVVNVLIKALKDRSSGVSSFKKIDREYLKRAFESGLVSVRISKAIIQGPARAGKTSLKCLITSKLYTSHDSTGCMETPQIAVSKYGSYDGSCWKCVSDDEMLDEAIRLMKTHKEHDKRLTEFWWPDPIDTGQIDIQTIPSHNTTATNTIASKPFASNVSSNVEKSVNSTNKTVKQILPEDIAHRIMQEAQTEMSRMFDSVINDPDKTECKEWLYFIDSGGQIQFQQLLHAFLPCASVLLLVTNLAENLSDQSCTKRQTGDQVSNVSEYSPTNETLLEQLILMVDACSEQQREAIERDPYLREIIRLPKRLHVMPIATHLDEFEKCFENLEQRDIALEKKETELKSILSSLKDNLICPNFSANEIFYIVDGRKAISGCFGDTVVKTISEQLKKQAFDVDIPLRWYAFEILLRKTAESFHGVLSIDICKTIGKEQLEMESEEVQAALKFCHLLNTMQYYPESNVPDLVFANPGCLFKIITELATLVSKICKNESIGVVTAEISDLARKGLVSEELLTLSPTVDEICCSNLFSDFTSKLLLLFQHRLLAAKAPEPADDMFFIPALLPLVNPSNDIHSADCPFVFLFTKNAPLGLFCSFIICLLSSHKETEWSISSIVSQYSNRITLNRIGKCSITFLEHRNRYEVYCPDERHRVTIKDELTEAMNNLLEIKGIRRDKVPKHGLYCPCDRSKSHIATIVRAEIVEHDEPVLFCIQDEKTVEYSDENASHLCWSWFSMNMSSNGKKRGMAPALDELMRLLSNEVSSKWHEIGIQLRIQRDFLHNLKSSHMDAAKKLLEVFENWEQNPQCPFTWEKIIDIIKQPPISNQRLAEHIENHLTTSNTSATCMPTASTVTTSITPFLEPEEKRGKKRPYPEIDNEDEETTNVEDAHSITFAQTTEGICGSKRHHIEMEGQEESCTYKMEEVSDITSPSNAETKIPCLETEEGTSEFATENIMPSTVLSSETYPSILAQNKALLRSYTVDQMAELLDGIGLPMYKEVFKKMEVNGVLFFELTEEDLQSELNISIKLHRNLIMKFINGVKLITTT